MQSLETRVRALFDIYGMQADKALHTPPPDDLGNLADQFASIFVESSPHGVTGGANNDRFRARLPESFARYRAAGGRHMTIKGLRVTELDHLHALADVDWEFSYVSRAGKSGHVTFNRFYFITPADGAPKIFASVAPDERQAMAAHGLL
jgi:hypothetical protein